MKPMTAEQSLRPRTPGTYVVNEVFYSVQGEGINVGVPMVFVRFSDCNLRCARQNEAGFDCDTEFMSGKEMTLPELNQAIVRACAGSGMPGWVLLTGGEPMLQVDIPLLKQLLRSWNVAIETNGTIDFPHDPEFGMTNHGIHVCVSPKSAEHTVRLKAAHEVKYVRRAGQAIPETTVKAPHQLISPAAQADGSFLREDVEWCIQLVKENPRWRLSLQTHKLMNVR